MGAVVVRGGGWFASSDFSLHPACGIELFEYLGSILVLNALCECVTGHKQAGMFLLEDFQEASTIWLAL